MKRKQSLVGSIRVMTTVFLILLALFILIVELGIHSKNHATRLDIERERFYRDQSEFMEGEINRIIERIAFQTGQVKLKLEKEVKARALEGYVIAQALYENGKENKSPAVLQKEILETLRLLSYKDGTGYYFVINLDGVTLMNKAAPHVENRNNLSSRDRAGRFHVKEMVELVRKEREGYYSYLWFKPENREENLTKNAYLKYFEPYDWLIGTGLYEEDTKRELQKSLLASIEYVYSQNPSPLFIAHKNGALLLGSGKGRNIMEEGSLEERVQFRKLILTAEQGGGFLEFPALSSEGTECRRLYFVREIEDWDWIIGTSQYTDKLEIEIQNMENYEKIIQREEVLRIMLITLLSCLMLIFLLNGMNKYFL
ncbi:MAG: cache domain-containing protein, partial [Spirochaetales bacterium]|nr:cache domain-containing protein [Spirochaetales bacterium]